MKCEICKREINYGIEVTQFSYHSEVGEYRTTIFTLCDECYDKIVLPFVCKKAEEHEKK